MHLLVVGGASGDQSARATGTMVTNVMEVEL